MSPTKAFQDDFDFFNLWEGLPIFGGRVGEGGGGKMQRNATKFGVLVICLEEIIAVSADELSQRKEFMGHLIGQQQPLAATGQPFIDQDCYRCRLGSAPPL